MASLAGQASLSWASPTLVREGYPILGMLRFFTDRRNFYLDGVAASRSGHFSFYFDKHYIIGVSGLEGRKIFYESKALDMSEGYALFTTAISSIKSAIVPHETGTSFLKWSSKTIINRKRNENLARNLPFLVGDAKGRLEDLAAAEGTSNMTPLTTSIASFIS